MCEWTSQLKPMHTLLIMMKICRRKFDIQFPSNFVYGMRKPFMNILFFVSSENVLRNKNNFEENRKSLIKKRGYISVDEPQFPLESAHWITVSVWSIIRPVVTRSVSCVTLKFTKPLWDNNVEIFRIINEVNFILGRSNYNIVLFLHESYINNVILPIIARGMQHAAKSLP